MHARMETRQALARSRPERGAGGYTLIEVLLYALTLAAVLVPLTTVIVVSLRSSGELDSLTRAQERNRAMTDRIASDLRPALASTVTIGAGGKSVSFTKPSGFDGTRIVPGPDVLLSFVEEAGEIANGQDDDGDGLVDECSLVRHDLASGELVELSGNLDWARCRFRLASPEIDVQIAHFARLPSTNELRSVVTTVNVVPRN